jgi:cell division protein FtsB
MAKKVLYWIKNKYVIFTAIMVVWIGFFDRYNVIRRIKDTVDLHKMQDERAYYEQKIQVVSKSRDELFSNEENLEKFARERYFMKKDNEEVFIVEE